jgi:hypothetical protein
MRPRLSLPYALLMFTLLIGLQTSGAAPDKRATPPTVSRSQREPSRRSWERKM